MTKIEWSVGPKTFCFAYVTFHGKRFTYQIEKNNVFGTRLNI